MEKHLTAAIGRYTDGDKGYLIHPISAIDAQIIVEIVELFKKLNFVAAVDIMKSYKYRKDEEVLDLLMDLNSKVGKPKSGTEVESQEAGGPLFTRYLKTCGRRIDLYLVISYDSLDVPVQNESLIKYCIQLNPTPENAKSIPFYANNLLVYDNQEERDQVIEALDKYMELYRGLFLKS